MDQLIELASKIIDKLSSVETGYNYMSIELNNEIPIFTGILKLYKYKPEDFLKVVNDILLHWGTFIKPSLIADIDRFNKFLTKYKIREMEAKQRLIDLALESNEVKLEQKKEMDELVDDLGDLMSTSAGLNRGLRRVSIKKHKLPNRKNKQLKKLESLTI